MKSLLASILLTVGLCALGVSSSGAQDGGSAQKAWLDPMVDFSGTWRNDSSSTIEIEMSADGRLSGEYTTIVGGPGGTPFSRPVVGQANGDQVVFYVDWSPYSMTAWVGQLLSTYEGTEVLQTTWLNTVNIEDADEPNDGWSGIRNGAGTFSRVSGP